jgi:hypothetical protein
MAKNQSQESKKEARNPFYVKAVFSESPSMVETAS